MGIPLHSDLSRQHARAPVFSEEIRRITFTAKISANQGMDCPLN